MDAERAGTLEWLRVDRRGIVQRHRNRRPAVHDYRVIAACAWVNPRYSAPVAVCSGADGSR
jgi:hypothetical protein